MSPVPTGLMNGSLPISLMSPAHPTSKREATAVKTSDRISGSFSLRRGFRRKHAMRQLRGASWLHLVENGARDAGREFGDNRGGYRVIHDRKLRGGGIGFHMRIDRDDFIGRFLHGFVVLP